MLIDTDKLAVELNVSSEQVITVLRLSVDIFIQNESKQRAEWDRDDPDHESVDVWKEFGSYGRIAEALLDELVT